MKKTLALLALLSSLALPAFAGDAKPKTPLPDHKAYPAIFQSIKATERAIAILGKAKADMGAHHAAADAALKTALAELNAGLAEAKTKPKKK